MSSGAWESSLVIGAVGGGFLLPREQRLAELAADERSRDDHQSLGKQVGIAGSLLSLLVLITVFVMTANPFS